MTRDELKTRTQQVINAIRVFKDKDYGWSEMEKMLYEILIELDDYDSDWHTGTPTEGGEYLVCRVPKAGYLFRFNQLCVFGNLMGSLDHKIFYIGEPGKDDFENITASVIAWQRIEPYKETDYE